MTKNDYISRQKLLKEFYEAFSDLNPWDNTDLYAVQTRIETIPAEEDVVRVVRCEKCKYAEVVTDILGTPWLYCTLPGRNFPKVHEEEFCSSGERREQT